MAGDHEQAGVPRQIGDEVFSQPVCEHVLFGVAAHIVERQYGDRWF